MPPLIDSDDLVDAHGVAEILHLAHRNTVSQYQKRYADMPRPIVNLGGGRTKLWLRSEMSNRLISRMRRAGLGRREEQRADHRPVVAGGPHASRGRSRCTSRGGTPVGG